MRQAFDDLVSRIGSKDAVAPETFKLFEELVNKCLQSWEQLAEQVSSEKAVIDLVKEFERLKQMKAEDQNQGAAALPLHEMMPN